MRYASLLQSKQKKVATPAKLATPAAAAAAAIKDRTPSVDKKPVLDKYDRLAPVNGGTPSGSGQKQDKRNSTGNLIVLGDDEDDLPALHKRVKLDPEPNIFADRANAVAGPAPRDDPVPAKKDEPDFDQRIRDLEAELAQLRTVRPPWNKEHFAAIDTVYRNIDIVKAEKVEAQRIRFDGAPCAQVGAAAPQPQVNGLGLNAGPVAYNYAAAVQQAQQVQQARVAQQQAALLQAGFGGAPNGAADSDSDHENPIGRYGAGTRLANDEDLHDLLKAAAEGESFEGESFARRWPLRSRLRLWFARGCPAGPSAF